MLLYFFGMMTVLVFALLWGVVIRVYTELTYKADDRREVKNAIGFSNILSLKEVISNDILTEALIVNVRQQKLNELIASGDLSEAVQNEQLKIEHARKNVIFRSLKAGLIDLDKVDSSSSI